MMKARSQDAGYVKWSWSCGLILCNLFLQLFEDYILSIVFFTSFLLLYFLFCIWDGLAF